MYVQSVVPKSIILQGVGWGKGTEAQEIKPGDKLMWNYGYISEVLSVEKVSNLFLNFTLKSESGQINQRRMKLTRLVARCEA
jgi:hypothetical protein